MAMAGANKSDFKLLAETLWSIPVDRPVPTPAKPQHLCLDKGCDYEQARWTAEAFGFVAHIRARGQKPPKRRLGKRPAAGRSSAPTPG